VCVNKYINNAKQGKRERGGGGERERDRERGERHRWIERACRGAAEYKMGSKHSGEVCSHSQLFYLD
jgi:hypothetical protein